MRDAKDIDSDISDGSAAGLYFDMLNPDERPREGEADTSGRPTAQFWLRKLDELEAPFRKRAFNDIVRLKFRAELRKLEAHAESMDEATTFKIALSMRMSGQR